MGARRAMAVVVLSLGLAWTSATAATWRDSLDASVAASWDSAPELCREALHAQPLEDRNGELRYRGAIARDPRVTPILLRRLLSGTDAPEVRLALTNALVSSWSRDAEAWAGPWAELSSTDSDPDVRGALVTGLRHAPGAVAIPALRGALAHPDAMTRGDAARVMGAHTDAHTFTADLVGALGDADAGVRAAATRSLGRMGATEAFEPVRRMLGDEDLIVQRSAEAALRQLDEARAREMSASPLGQRYHGIR